MQMHTNNSLVARNFYLFFTVVWTFTVIVASNIPASDIPSILPNNSDILIHFIWYSVMTFGMILSLKHKVSRPVVTALLLTISIGLMNEFLQKILSVGRSFELSDILSNTLGSLIGTLPFVINRR